MKNKWQGSRLKCAISAITHWTHILVNVTWVFDEKNAYSADVGWSFLYMSIRFCWLIVTQFFYNLNDILSSSFIKGWEWGVEIFNNNCRLIYFSVHLYQFQIRFLRLCCLMSPHLGLLWLLGGLILLPLCNHVCISQMDNGALVFHCQASGWLVNDPHSWTLILSFRSKDELEGTDPAGMGLPFWFSS